MREHLDTLARLIPSADGKNAIHACRDSHPLGKNNSFKYRNAFSATHSIHTVDRFGCSLALQWIERQAMAEANA